MKIGSIGYNYSHDSDFVMDRPHGNGCWLFLLIKTPSLFEINGKEQIVKKDSFIIFSYDTPCKYRAYGDSYADDWMYFDIDDSDLDKFKELEIPVNEPVHIGSLEELSQIIHILTYEHYSADVHREEIEKHYLEILLLKLSRIIKSKSSISSAFFVERNYKFTHLRTRIYTMPDTVPDIEGMAAEVGMSRSGFQHQYKKMFNVSVMTDVINGRLDRAKRLLSSTNLPYVLSSEISAISIFGFSKSNTSNSLLLGIVIFCFCAFQPCTVTCFFNRRDYLV